jgi:hypothetical protein
MRKDRDWITMDLVEEQLNSNSLLVGNSLVLNKYDEFGQIEEVIEGYDSIKVYLKKLKKDERNNNKG